jgi:hypothetical protein
MSKTTKAGRRAAFQYHVATKWVIRGEHDEGLMQNGGIVAIPQHAPRGWKVKAWVRGGSRLRAHVIRKAFVLIEHAPLDATVIYELTPRR